MVKGILNSNLAVFIDGKIIGSGKSSQQIATEIGVNRATIDRWRSGESTPRAIALRRLAEVLGITEKELFQIAGIVEETNTSSKANLIPLLKSILEADVSSLSREDLNFLVYNFVKSGEENIDPDIIKFLLKVR